MHLTLDDCERIAAEHARPQPARGTGIALTPAGRAHVAARRLARMLAELDHEARIVAVNVVLAELARLRAEDVQRTA